MPTPTDREQLLQRLAAINGSWAETELNLIEAIRTHKRRLAELPEFIRRLEEKRKAVTIEMNRAGQEHDVLEAEGDDCPYPCDGCEAVLGRGENCPSYVNAAIFRTWSERRAETRAATIGGEFMDWANAQDCPYDAKFHAWADDMADDYADHLLTVAPPHPDTSELFG